MKSHPGNGWSFLVGPAVFLFFLACLAVVALIAWALHRTEGLAVLGDRARQRLERGRILPMLWGLSATVLIFALTVLLMRTRVLGLLGLVLLVAGLALVGMGLAVAAVAVGRDLARALGDLGEEDLPALRLGLWALFLASWLPGIGWLLTGLAGAAGMGAVLEVLIGRDRAASPADGGTGA